jgi:CspA family cold shock protein
MKKKGKVKWYDEFKGFGFIESENGEDIFVHRTGIIGSEHKLQPEQRVVFEKQQGEKGPIAVNVELDK